jgi:hypothetical protein
LQATAIHAAQELANGPQSGPHIGHFRAELSRVLSDMGEYPSELVALRNACEYLHNAILDRQKVVNRAR